MIPNSWLSTADCTSCASISTRLEVRLGLFYQWGIFFFNADTLFFDYTPSFISQEPNQFIYLSLFFICIYYHYTNDSRLTVLFLIIVSFLAVLSAALFMAIVSLIVITYLSNNSRFFYIFLFLIATPLLLNYWEEVYFVYLARMESKSFEVTLLSWNFLFNPSFIGKSVFVYIMSADDDNLSLSYLSLISYVALYLFCFYKVKDVALRALILASCFYILKSFDHVFFINKIIIFIYLFYTARKYFNHYERV